LNILGGELVLCSMERCATFQSSALQIVTERKRSASSLRSRDEE
jgi:hypothetical protein